MKKSLTAEVRDFYDDQRGGAALAYEQMMGKKQGHMWFHGDRRVLDQGGTPLDASMAMLRRLGDHADLGEGRRVVEFGSGMGGAARNLASLYGVKSVVGVTNSDSLNQHARRLTGPEFGGRVSFVTIGDDDYRHLSLWDDQSVDAVVSMEAICHLPNKLAFFRAAHRILKPGAGLVVLDWLERAYGQYQTRKQIAKFIDPVCRWFSLARPLGTLGSYSELMRQAGFDVTHAQDEYPGRLCLGNTEPVVQWEAYQGPKPKQKMKGKLALDAAKAAGVFTVGTVVAVKG